MSCTITYETIDGQTVTVRNYTGDVSMNLTSASNGGADYVAPACSVKTTSHSVLEPSTATLFALGLILGALSLRIRARGGT